MTRKINKINCFGINLLISMFFIFQSSNLVGQTNQLIIFTGSDWCLPCMRLDKNILNDSLFIQFTTHAITFVHADFPQKKKLSADEISRNEKLAALYNTKGIFPFIVVVKDGLPTQIPFHDQTAKEVIASIQHILQGYE